MKEHYSELMKEIDIYSTYGYNNDGVFCLYMHDKETIEESDIIWSFDETRVLVSVDGGYSYSILSDIGGNACITSKDSIKIRIALLRECFRYKIKRVKELIRCQPRKRTNTD